MAQPATIIDATGGETVKHGSQAIVFTLIIGGTSTLVCEQISYSKDTRAIDQMDEVGKPSKSAYVPIKGEGSMTVQVKTSSTRLTAGATGSILDTDGSTSIPFIVTRCGPEFQQDAAAKIKISFVEKLN